jgi:pimeloyl-ACP methyl ester carboxylesterase
VGHDLGGGIAQLLALQGRAAAMVLIDSVAFDAWPIEGVRMLQSVEAAQETDELVRDTVALTLQLGMGRSERLTPELAEAYSSPFTGVGGPQAFFRAVRAIDGRGLAGREEDLAALDAPTLILWGEEDPFLGVELAERLSECLPASSLALLPGCSHFLPEDAPETIVPLVYEYLRARYLALPHGSHPHGPTPITLGRHAPA